MHRRRLALCAVLISALAPQVAIAQLAPLGGHYGGRPSDTGFMGQVGASGAYQASVPFDFPAARQGLPVPIHVTYTGRGLGAAGLGWDVPLSYIQRDTSFAHRRPVEQSNVAPQPRTQITLVLDGQTMPLVQTATGWLVQREGQELLIQQPDDASWVVYDGTGHTYTFTNPSSLLNGLDVWLLTSVTAPGNDLVKISYKIANPNTSSVSIEPTTVDYNFDSTGTARNRISLTYDVAADWVPRGFLHDKVIMQADQLQSVNVIAWDSSEMQQLRSYELSYKPDVDTHLARLSSVQMRGRDGSREHDFPVPVATYSYGSATVNGSLSYGPKPSYNADEIAVTVVDPTAHPATGTGYSTIPDLIDITGDGKPEFVKNWFSPAAGAWLPYEMRTTHDLRYNFFDENIDNEMTWRQVIDVNGDGRLDIVDAQEQPGYWVVYLNNPDTGWQRLAISTTQLQQDLRARAYGPAMPSFL